jgi:hypothetical protein
MDFKYEDVVSVAAMNEMTVKELRAMCSGFGLSKYSKAPKPKLIEMLQDYYIEQLNLKTAKELRTICVELGFTGVAKTRKDILIEKILSVSDEEEEIMEEEEIIDISSDDEEIDISSDDEEESPTNGTITVIHGARTRSIPFVSNKTVWDIHQQMANEMGIPAHPMFTVNDSDAPNNVIINEGDTIEFFKSGGNKG